MHIRKKMVRSVIVSDVGGDSSGEILRAMEIPLSSHHGRREKNEW